MIKTQGTDGRSPLRVVLQDWIRWKGGIKPGKDVCLPLTSHTGADGIAPIIILHIQDAQVISPQVLGELIYIIWQVSTSYKVASVDSSGPRTTLMKQHTSQYPIPPTPLSSFD